MPSLRKKFKSAQKSASEKLIDAIEDGKIKKVRYLLNRGVDLNGDFRDIPLHAAIRNHYPKIAALLIENGASIEIMSPGGSTPLMEAAAIDDAETVRLLIDRGALLDVVGSRGKTAEELAWDSEHWVVAEMLQNAPEIRQQEAEEKIRVVAAAAEEEMRRVTSPVLRRSLPAVKPFKFSEND